MTMMRLFVFLAVLFALPNEAKTAARQFRYEQGDCPSCLAQKFTGNAANWRKSVTRYAESGEQILEADYNKIPVGSIFEVEEALLKSEYRDVVLPAEDRAVKAIPVVNQPTLSISVGQTAPLGFQNTRAGLAGNYAPVREVAGLPYVIAKPTVFHLTGINTAFSETGFRSAGFSQAENYDPPKQTVVFGTPFSLRPLSSFEVALLLCIGLFVFHHTLNRRLSYIYRIGHSPGRLLSAYQYYIRFWEASGEALIRHCGRVRVLRYLLF